MVQEVVSTHQLLKRKLDLMRTMKQFGEMFFCFAEPQLTVSFIGDAAGQGPLAAASNYSVTVPSQPPPCAYDWEPE